MFVEHVLVVDDDELVTEFIANVLRHGGYRATFATHWAMALQIIEGEERIDLLLVDLIINDGRNGRALSQMACMRRLGRRIVYMTGYEIPNVVLASQRPILHKPFDGRSLIRAIEQTLASSPV
jgi:CheY-like chemotaxis protein